MEAAKRIKASHRLFANEEPSGEVAAVIKELRGTFGAPAHMATMNGATRAKWEDPNKGINASFRASQDGHLEFEATIFGKKRAHSKTVFIDADGKDHAAFTAKIKASAKVASQELKKILQEAEEVVNDLREAEDVATTLSRFS